ncbi:histidine phosphatase, partial [Rathayibacter tritici]|uniref:histidine phosphatase family protein n=1 Tax=Rathayibacter tritici TaxID=33888 RepID=UPI000CE7ADBB
MPTLLLVRHGRTTANTAGILAGRTAGVRLDDVGRTQAARTGERLAALDLASVLSSPLERCRQTTRFVLDRQATPPPIVIDRGITECDYGDWSGRSLRDLATEPLWATVQNQPSAVVFPGGEAMLAMQARAVSAIRRHDATVAQEHGAGAVWAAVSHGDTIKAILADALGMHLDLFQRLSVGPASVSIIRYGSGRPDVIAMNTEAGDLGWLRTAAPAADAATPDPP